MSKVKGESRQLFEWVKASEELPEGKGKFNSVDIRCVDPLHRFITRGFKNYDEENPALYMEYSNLSLITINGEGNYHSTVDVKNIEWLKPIPQSSLKEETKIIVWKDGTYKVTEGQTWEYENDENWLVTIQSSLTPKSISMNSFKDFFLKRMEKNYLQYYKDHAELEKHMTSGEVTMTIPEILKISKEYDQSPKSIRDSDIEKMAEKKYPLDSRNVFDRTIEDEIMSSDFDAQQKDRRTSFIAGCKAIMELNNK